MVFLKPTALATEQSICLGKELLDFIPQPGLCMMSGWTTANIFLSTTDATEN